MRAERVTPDTSVRASARVGLLALALASLGGCVFPEDFAIDDALVLDVGDTSDTTDTTDTAPPDADADTSGSDADTAGSDGDTVEPCNGTCGESTTCCTHDAGATCVDLDGSTAHCGACNSPCAPGLVCQDGLCLEPACPEGQLECAGACTDVSAHPQHCGACDVVCEAGEECDGGACVCPAGANGTTRSCTESEVCCAGSGCADTTASPHHCGACGSACRPGERCVGGTCVCGDAGAGVACTAEQVCCVDTCVATEACLCGGVPCNAGELCCGEPGSEACAAIDSVEHCGACGVACHAETERCGLQGCACLEGRADCDGDPANGCEVDLTQPEHCGRCNKACADGAECLEGECRCGTVECEAGRACCLSTQCVVLDTNVDHCGGCGLGCPAGGTNVEFVFCAESACQTSCTTGYANCDGMFGNGCETHTAADLNNCGACGAHCAGGLGACTCTNGVCGGALGCKIQ